MIINSGTIDNGWRQAGITGKREFYGAPLGILLLERSDIPGIRPFIPGSVGNASTWNVPVRYHTIPGLTFKRLLEPHNAEVSAIVAQAARDLEREGARVITANCGFMVRYQEAAYRAVDVPVLLSSLLLVPHLERMLPRERSLGILTATAPSLKPELFAACGAAPGSDRIVVEGLESCPGFAAAFVNPAGDLDVEAVQREAVDAAVALVKRRPDVGMLLLECSELPPYAAAIQRATGLPVFDFTSMVDFAVGGLTRKPYTGLY